MQHWYSEFFSIPPDSILINGNFNSWLVLLSISIAVLASFMGLQVASQAAQTSSPIRKQISLLIGGIALGCGIWSMHFIGMLAFKLCTPVKYNFAITLFSLLPGICASWVALNYTINHKLHWTTLLMSGTLVGAGIGTMHYTGMAAMEMAPLLRYDMGIFLLSILVAVVLAVLALGIRCALLRIKTKRLELWHVNAIASVIMGLAISGMHYTGMAAARFVRPPGLELSQQTEFISFYLALGVTAATVLVVVLVLGLNLLFKYMDISSRAVEGERWVRAMMDTAVDAIIIINGQGDVITANKATHTLLGWKPGDLIGNNINVLMEDPFHSEHDGYLANYLHTGEASIIGKGREVTAVTHNGEKISVRLAIGHLKMNEQNYFVGFLSDISHRIKMENAARDSEAKFRSLIGNIPGIAYRCNAQPPWQMLYISDAVYDVTGYSSSEFLASASSFSFLDIIHPDDRQYVLDFPDTDDKYLIEYRITRKDGSVRWLMEYGRQIIEEQTGRKLLDGFIMDITERKGMEEVLRNAKNKAEQAAAARSAFLANMSHEIRTPMNAIIGFSDILLENPLQTEQKKHLKTINNSAKSLLHLLNDILDSAKLDKGKIELEIREFSVTQEIDAVISTLWLQARKKGLEIRSNISTNLEKTYLGAPDRIRQILTNLIGNAIKFTHEGHIAINVEPTPMGQVEFSISDTGIGMSQEQVDKVFDAFTQAELSMSRKYGGTGLGTTISKQLVELMGGEISAKSTQEVGTTFRFTLPLTLPINSATTGSEDVQVQDLELPELNILVVDDIQQNIDILTILLQRRGHRVITARDGQQALIRMRENSAIDLVLMDIQMPVMDGLTSARTQREYEREKNLKALPIIALTASVLEEDRIAAQKAGMEGFANKPVDMADLYREITRVLGIKNIEPASPHARKKNTSRINMDRGEAIWGSKQAYIEQCKDLLKSQTDSLEKHIQDSEGENWPALNEYAHRLKGVTGNLNLDELHALFAKLETHANAQSRQSTAVLHSIKNSIGEHLEEFEKFLKETNTPSARTTQKATKETQAAANKYADKKEILDLIAQLKTAAKRCELNDDLLNQLSALNLPGAEQAIHTITDAINDFEFSQAEQHLDQLAAAFSHAE